MLAFLRSNIPAEQLPILQKAFFTYPQPFVRRTVGRVMIGRLYRLPAKLAMHMVVTIKNLAVEAFVVEIVVLSA